MGDYLKPLKCAETIKLNNEIYDDSWSKGNLEYLNGVCKAPI